MNAFDILPHRYPFLFADRILEIERGKRVVCLRNITIDDEYLTCHFKDNPAFPFTLIVEAMAQTSGLLLRSDTGAAGKLAFLAAISNAKFVRPIRAGEELKITSALTKSLPPLHIFSVSVSAGTETVACAEIILSDGAQ